MKTHTYLQLPIICKSWLYDLVVSNAISFIDLSDIDYVLLYKSKLTGYVSSKSLLNKKFFWI